MQILLLHQMTFNLKSNVDHYSVFKLTEGNLPEKSLKGMLHRVVEDKRHDNKQLRSRSPCQQNKGLQMMFKNDRKSEAIQCSHKYQRPNAAPLAANAQANIAMAFTQNMTVI